MNQPQAMQAAPQQLVAPRSLLDEVVEVTVAKKEAERKSFPSYEEADKASYMNAKPVRWEDAEAEAYSIRTWRESPQRPGLLELLEATQIPEGNYSKYICIACGAPPGFCPGPFMKVR